MAIRQSRPQSQRRRRNPTGVGRAAALGYCLVTILMMAGVVLLPAIARAQAPLAPPGAASPLDAPRAEELPSPAKTLRATENRPRPEVLQAPLVDATPPIDADNPSDNDIDFLLRWPMDPPLGYSGPSSVRPRDVQENSHFVPMEDRWRVGLPEWDRYDKGHPFEDEYPFVEGDIRDPYHQNILKGDYPWHGQNNFFVLTAAENFLAEVRQVPTPTTPFESTSHPNQEEFFGDPDQVFLLNNLILSTELNHGDGAFKPPDWRIKTTQIYNLNHLIVDELGIVNPDVRKGTARFRQDFALEEYFVEAKLADLSPDYDFVSTRLGSQFFNSDFRGFIFSDTNRGARLFGTRGANRDQFNVIAFDQTEKDTNSLLNTFDDRHQNTIIANYYRQDFIWPGYTAQLSYHYNHDKASFKFNDNDMLVRPDPVGVFAPHQIDSHYLGWSGDGHINRFNISHSAYYVFGEDQLNPIAGVPQTIDAWMAALELSYDRDWMRFRSSYFFASGDNNPNDLRATGFDTIFDNPAFAGGGFSFWQRQTIGLFGVNLKQRNSLVPDLRSSKFQGQTNFVNPGLQLLNLGVDADITPKLRLINNVNFLWFNQTEVLETFLFAPDIDTYIGTDLSSGFEYRPLLTNNVILISGVSALLPGAGFHDLYDPYLGRRNALGAAFMDLVVTY